ncbi:MAG TPA: hypothetical protein VM658_12375 [bacterium]|nr:hypothetical protein [bacterium]
MGDKPQIIGLTGSFGSGCTFISKEILEKAGYQFVSLSDILKAYYKKDVGNDPDPKEKRRAYQNFGDAKRQCEGYDFFAKEASEIISKQPDVKK